MITLSLDTKKLDLIIKDGDRFIVSKEGEEALSKFYEMKKRIDEAEKQLKKLIKERMEKEKTDRVEGEKIKIIKRVYGNRFKITDPELVQQLGFGKVKKWVGLDIEAVEKYLEEKGELPPGVKRNEDRKEDVKIDYIKSL